MAKISEASKKDDIKPQRLGFHKNLHFWIKRVVINAAIGLRFPIHVVISMSVKSPYPTYIDPNSKNAMLLKVFWLTV